MPLFAGTLKSGNGGSCMLYEGSLRGPGFSEGSGKRQEDYGFSLPSTAALLHAADASL